MRLRLERYNRTYGHQFAFAIRFGHKILHGGAVKAGIVMELRFIGNDGSMGYRRGQVYRLRIRTNLRGTKPVIQDPILCPYGSWEAFWDNWERVRRGN